MRVHVLVLVLSALVAAGIAGFPFAGGSAVGAQQSAAPPQSAAQQSESPKQSQPPKQSETPPQAEPQGKSTPVESVAGLLSKTSLNPPLRSGVEQVRFSPNGTYILVQDAVGVYVLTKKPLSLLFWLAARDAPAARFSADSRSLIIASRDGIIGRWNLPGGQPAGQKQIDAKEGCVSALLSRDGELFACEGPRLEVRLFRVNSGEEIFSDYVKVPKLKPMRWYPISRPHQSAFAEPIGYSWARSPKPVIDHASSTQHMDFSPDNKFFLCADPNRDAVVMDLTANKKVSIGGSLRHSLDAMRFITPEKIATRELEKKQKTALLSFPSGRELEKLPINGAPQGAASNVRYLIFSAPESEGVNALDLDSKSIVKFPAQVAMDFVGDEMVGVSAGGAVSILHEGASEPRASLALPRAPLGPLRVAAVSPDLRTLVIAAGGQAGAWDLTTGNRLNSYPGIVGAWCEDALSCYLQFLRQGNLAPRTEKINLNFAGISPSSAPKDVNGFAHELINWPIPVGADPGDGTTAPATKASPSDEEPTEQDISSGRVILRIFRQPSKTLSFNSILQALDVKTGLVLWSRVLESGAPIPFANPQGDRVVFAWRAESPGARAAAGRIPAVRERLQQARLQAQDSFFEVVDARTGKMLGGAVVQNGAGPDRFDSAFSAGDWLVTSRDGNRLVIYSLASGGEKVRTFGYYPAISPESGLLAMTDGGATLTLYDLAKFQKGATIGFPSEVAFIHFAADGKRLFVLTVNQIAYVLDVSEGRLASAIRRTVVM